MKSVFTAFLLLAYLACFGQKNTSPKTFETLCDSVYPDRGYKIIQLYFPEGIDTNGNSNTVFQFLKTRTNPKVIYQDTIYSHSGEIEFKDFNGDGIKDVLIQNISDVRSNWTYYLYLVDTIQDKLQKIRGFEEIKNPKYLPEHRLIDNYVSSGKNWTSFYKIEGDSIREFDIVIYDDHSENGTYDQEYKNAIKTILKSNKASR